MTQDLKEGNVFFPDVNPIPSDLTFGHGMGGRLGSTAVGFLQGAFDVAPNAQNSTLNVAYIAFTGAVDMYALVRTTSGDFEVDTGFLVPEVPEPGAVGALMMPISWLLLRRRRPHISAPRGRRSHANNWTQLYVRTA